MKKLFLHIGTGKTGSTAIQECLRELQKADLLDGAGYPGISGKNHHNELCCLVMPHERIRRDIKSRFPQRDGAYDEYVAQIRSNLEKGVAGDSPAIISGEYFTAFSREEAASFVEMFKELGFTEVHILLYFREPVTLYLSQIQQKIKASSKFRDPKKYVQPYVDIYERWQGLADSFTIREFSRQSLEGGDVINDFILLASTKLEKKISVPSDFVKAHNESLSPASMKILQRFRVLLYPEQDNFFDSRTRRLLEFLPELESRLGCKKKPRLRDDISNLVRHNHIEELARLESLCGLKLGDEANGEKPGPAKPLKRDIKKIEKVIEFSDEDEIAYERMLMTVLAEFLNEN